MRIDLHYGPQQVSETDHHRSSSSSSLASGAGRSLLQQDQTELSGAHVQVQALAAQVSQLPDVRAEKVQALRQAVEGKSYRLDAQKIAGALLSHMILGEGS